MIANLCFRHSSSVNLLRTCQYRTTWIMTLMTSFRWLTNSFHIEEEQFHNNFPRTLSQSANERFFTQSCSTEKQKPSTLHLVTLPRGILVSSSSHLWFVFDLCWSQISCDDHMKLQTQKYYILSSWQENCLVPMSGQLELHLCIIATSTLFSQKIMNFPLSYQPSDAFREEWDRFWTYDEHKDGNNRATGLFPGRQT